MLKPVTQRVGPGVVGTGLACVGPFSGGMYFQEELP